MASKAHGNYPEKRNLSVISTTSSKIHGYNMRLYSNGIKPGFSFINLNNYICYGRPRLFSMHD